MTLLVAAMLIASCAPTPVTGLYVVVTTDLSASEVDQLRLTASGPGMTSAGSPTFREVPASQGSLRVLLTPSASGALSVSLEAEARMGTGVVVSRSVETTYAAGEIRVLPIVLAAACRDRECPGQECDRGECVDRTVRVEDLDRWHGELPDAGTAPDGSSSFDAGPQRDGATAPDTGPPPDAMFAPDAETRPDGGGATCMAGHDPPVCPAPYVCTTMPTGCEIDLAVDSISSGPDHTCAWSSGGSRVVCWGEAADGRLGGPRPTSTLVGTSDLLVVVPGIDSATSVATGDDFGCAVHDGGRISCWGGAAVDWGASADAHAELRLAEGDTAVEVVAGNGFACARTSTGSVYCWGDGSSGQLGRSIASSVEPLRVGELTGMIGLAAGGAHACAWSTSTAWCWGANTVGQLGAGDVVPHVGPMSVMLPAGVTFVRSGALGDRHSCIVTGAPKTPSTVYCWGADDRGQLLESLGPGTYSATPLAWARLDGIQKVVTGATHTCVLDDPGAPGRFATLICWGSHADADDAATELRPNGKGVGQPLSAGRAHTCFIAAGGVHCFGANDLGQLGTHGSSGPRPQRVESLR